MSTKRQYLFCDECKNLVGMISGGGGTLVCCGKPMRALKAGEVDASAEKHVPVCKRDGNRLIVEVSSTPHPQSHEHHIAWIAVCGEGLTQRAELPQTAQASAEFTVGDGPLTVYAYCNLHGLWETAV